MQPARVMATITRFTFDALTRPTRTFEQLSRDPRRLGIGTRALTLTAALYTLMYVMLAAGGGAPSSFEPWLAIPKEHYYHYNVYLLAPSMFMCWILAGGVTQLLARRWGGSGTFEDTLAALGLGASAASWCTLGHDLALSALAALRVIDPRQHEIAMNSPTVWRALIWTLMILYVIAFLILFSKGIRAAQRISPARAAALGFVAFAVYQTVFFIFNR
jgi:hypothetical protein